MTVHTTEAVSCLLSLWSAIRNRSDTSIGRSKFRIVDGEGVVTRSPRSILQEEGSLAITRRVRIASIALLIAGALLTTGSLT